MVVVVGVVVRLLGVNVVDIGIEDVITIVVDAELLNCVVVVRDVRDFVEAIEDVGVVVDKTVFDGYYF